MNPYHLNKAGTLQEARPLAKSGNSNESAHLIFTSRDGRRCAIYAAFARPVGSGPYPLVIHAPGGGQTVRDEDLAFWVDRGFACVSFDWQAGLFDHDPARKSCWPAGVVLQGEVISAWGQFVIPLAVEAVGVVIDWAARFPEVDAGRIGMTGISWGGYLTWAANAHEPRLKCAAPVYGCGGLFEKNRPGGQLPLPREIASSWAKEWDPVALAHRQLSPVCWVSGTNDFFGFPGDADAILDAMPLAHRRSHEPGLNHAILPEDSATIVAWMRHYLAGGPALPDEPRWTQTGLVADRLKEVASIEEWWTPSVGGEDMRCWWPGSAPGFATAKIARVRYKSGIALTSPVQDLHPAGTPDDLGDLWPDARAGTGCWSLGGTQLYNNLVRLVPVPDNPGRARVQPSGGPSPFGLALRQFSDPRFNRSGFAGMRLKLEASEPLPEKLTASIQTRLAGRKPARKEYRGDVHVGPQGLVELSRWSLPFLPPGVSWRRVLMIWLEGFAGSPLEIGPIERIRR